MLSEAPSGSGGMNTTHQPTLLKQRIVEGALRKVCDINVHLSHASPSASRMNEAR